MSPQSLQCRGWPRGDTKGLRPTAEHLHPIPRAGATASMASQGAAASCCPSLGQSGDQTFPTPPCPTLARVSSAEANTAGQGECPGGATSWGLVPRGTRPCWHAHKGCSNACCGRAVACVVPAQGHSVQQHFHFSPWRGVLPRQEPQGSGKWGSELMRLILAPHPLWKLSQACFGNTAGIFMSGICKGIFILDLETTGPAARFRKRRGKKHKTSER